MIESGMILFGKIIIAGIITSGAGGFAYILSKTTQQDIANATTNCLNEAKNTMVGVCVGGLILVPMIAVSMALVDMGVNF